MALSSRRVVFDTNMLLAIAQFKVDVFEEVKKKLGGTVEFFVPKSVFAELEKIAAKGQKYENAVGIAMKAIENNNAREIDTVESDADNALLGLSGQGFFVASNDSVLRKKIKMLGGKNIYLRRKKLVEIE